MKLFVGIDGGGSKTTALLADKMGRLLAKAAAGIGNPNHASEAELQTRFSDLMQKLFENGNAHRAQCVSVFAGLAGVTSEKTALLVKTILANCGLNSASITVDHDIRIALAGGLAGSPGMALIVGTGSSCYGRNNEGRTWQSGGWGALLADEGSGYFLGREAIIAAVRMADGRQTRSPLGQAVFSWFNITDVSQVLDRVHDDNLSRTEIAAFAQTLLPFAADGDPAAVNILQRGAEQLALMVAANHAQLPTAPTPRLVITGGLGTAQSCYRPLLVDAIQSALPEIKIIEPVLTPVAGAVLLAIQEYSGSITETIVENLKGIP